MPDSYSERDAADLLRRAALLQARHDYASGAGLSLDEIKHAADSAGIDPAFVEQAALGAGDDEAASGRVFGIQTGARRTRVVPGRVSENEWGQMVATLRRRLGGTGDVETIGEVRQWRRAPIVVSVEPRGDYTRITASASWSGEAKFLPLLGIVCFLIALVVTGVGISTGDSGAFFFAAMMAAYTVLCGWAGWGRLGPKGARVEQTFDRALDALAAHAGSDERAEAVTQAPEGSRLDSALLDDDSLANSAEPLRQRARS